VWLSEFGPRNAALRGGKAIAVVGPLQLAGRQFKGAHTSAALEGWYVLAGEQCLETPAGPTRAGPGETMTVRPNVPMELNVTGTALRRAFALVIHDSAQPRGKSSNWKPSGTCSR
jgi:quercetin dioxygenase-like cupin family protein